MGPPSSHNAQSSHSNLSNHLGLLSHLLSNPFLLHPNSNHRHSPNHRLILRLSHKLNHRVNPKQHSPKNPSGKFQG